MTENITDAIWVRLGQVVADMACRLNGLLIKIYFLI